MIRKRIKFRIPEEKKVETQLNYTNSKQFKLNNLGPFIIIEGSEEISNYITETEDSRYKSLDILSYLINDLRKILHKNESEKIREDSQGEDIGETMSLQKIIHIEDIIQKLPSDLREEFNHNGQNEQVKQLIDQFRTQKKNIEEGNSYQCKF